MRSTIVLVHGAFAESASWDRVIEVLMHTGTTASSPPRTTTATASIAAANPLRGLAADAAERRRTSSRTLDGPSCSSATPTAER